MDMSPLFLVLGATARSVVGWANKALEDGKIEDYEYKKLIATVLRVGLLGAIAAYFPGLDLSWISATAVALAADYIFKLIKK